jgi:hypothetical protein
MKLIDLNTGDLIIALAPTSCSWYSRYFIVYANKQTKKCDVALLYDNRIIAIDKDCNLSNWQFWDDCWQKI